MLETTTERQPKYCNKCGKELVVDDIVLEYDIHSGQPAHVDRSLTCPEYKETLRSSWWPFPSPSGNGHYSHEVEISNGKIKS